MFFNTLLSRWVEPSGLASGPFSAARQDLPFALQKAAARLRDVKAAYIKSVHL
jgi:hypothetical protein